MLLFDKNNFGCRFRVSLFYKIICHFFYKNNFVHFSECHFLYKNNFVCAFIFYKLRHFTVIQATCQGEEAAGSGHRRPAQGSPSDCADALAGARAGGANPASAVVAALVAMGRDA